MRAPSAAARDHTNTCLPSSYLNVVARLMRIIFGGFLPFLNVLKFVALLIRGSATVGCPVGTSCTNFHTPQTVIRR